MAAPQRIALDPGELLLWPAWLEPARAQALFLELRHSIAWRQDRIRLFGKVHDLPRLQAFYGEADSGYGYSGLELEPLPWLPALADLGERVQASLGDFAPASPGLPAEQASAFNAVLCNLYRDGRDSNGWHADDEAALGPEPLVASISLGATRRFRMRRKDRVGAAWSMDLPSGSLLVMGAGLQAHWQHCLTKTARPVGERINLTYRRVVP